MLQLITVSRLFATYICWPSSPGKNCGFSAFAALAENRIFRNLISEIDYFLRHKNINRSTTKQRQWCSLHFCRISLLLSLPLVHEAFLFLQEPQPAASSPEYSCSLQVAVCYYSDFLLDFPEVLRIHSNLAIQHK